MHSEKIALIIPFFFFFFLLLVKEKEKKEPSSFQPCNFLMTKTLNEILNFIHKQTVSKKYYPNHKVKRLKSASLII